MLPWVLWLTFGIHWDFLLLVWAFMQHYGGLISFALAMVKDWVSQLFHCMVIYFSLVLVLSMCYSATVSVLLGYDLLGLCTLAIGQRHGRLGLVRSLKVWSTEVVVAVSMSVLSLWVGFRVMVNFRTIPAL
jgi:hypothetical protein